MSESTLLVVAGCNGSGKSSFSKQFVSTDFLPFDYDIHFLKAYASLRDSDIRVENSINSDQANKEVSMSTSMKEDEAWKLVSRIVTATFDIVDVTDKATGYMRTGWVVKTFKNATVRTRLIIKTGSSDPLVYKAKLISEIGKAGSTADESFKPWDRVLRTFENTIPELQGRLGK